MFGFFFVVAFWLVFVCLGFCGVFIFAVVLFCCWLVCVFFFLFSSVFIARLSLIVLHHHSVFLFYLLSSLVSHSPSSGSLVQFLCSRILNSSLKLYSVFRFILHFLFPKSSSVDPKLFDWMITHSFPPGVSKTCFHCFAFP